MCLTELVFRLLITQLDRETYAAKWFRTCIELRTEFLEIREAEFETVSTALKGNMNVFLLSQMTELIKLYNDSL